MLLSLDSEAEFEPINEQPKHQLVHLNRFRKADSFSHQAFDPRAQREMSPLQLLRPPLADYMLVWPQMPLISAPAIGVKAANANGSSSALSFKKA